MIVLFVVISQTYNVRRRILSMHVSAKGDVFLVMPLKRDKKGKIHLNVCRILLVTLLHLYDLQRRRNPSDCSFTIQTLDKYLKSDGRQGKIWFHFLSLHIWPMMLLESVICKDLLAITN